MNAPRPVSIPSSRGKINLATAMLSNTEHKPCSRCASALRTLSPLLHCISVHSWINGYILGLSHVVTNLLSNGRNCGDHFRHRTPQAPQCPQSTRHLGSPACASPCNSPHGKLEYLSENFTATPTAGAVNCESLFVSLWIHEWANTKLLYTVPLSTAFSRPKCSYLALPSHLCACPSIYGEYCCHPAAAYRRTDPKGHVGRLHYPALVGGSHGIVISVY